MRTSVTSTRLAGQGHDRVPPVRSCAHALGDGVMALFIPVITGENHADRAIRCFFHRPSTKFEGAATLL